VTPFRLGVIQHRLPRLLPWPSKILPLLPWTRPEASTGKKELVSQLVERPVAAEEPEGALEVSNDSNAQAPVNGHTSSVTDMAGRGE
jgi:hypothetical protein